MWYYTDISVVSRWKSFETYEDAIKFSRQVGSYFLVDQATEPPTHCYMSPSFSPLFCSGLPEFVAVLDGIKQYDRTYGRYIYIMH